MAELEMSLPVLLPSYPRSNEFYKDIESFAEFWWVMLKSFVSRLFLSAEVKTAEPVFLMHTIFSYSKTNSLTYLQNRIFVAFSYKKLILTKDLINVYIQIQNIPYYEIRQIVENKAELEWLKKYISYANFFSLDRCKMRKISWPINTTVTRQNRFMYAKIFSL